ncbi:hypothetical protein HYX16_05715 [Candidatus Woesearchaeota archaeon]|nr:hypothetical protein [Candidatus Woesearchaeota archaeon]
MINKTLDKIVFGAILGAFTFFNPGCSSTKVSFDDKIGNEQVKYYNHDDGYHSYKGECDGKECVHIQVEKPDGSIITYDDYNGDLHVDCVGAFDGVHEGIRHDKEWFYFGRPGPAYQKDFMEYLKKIIIRTKIKTK